MSRWRALALFVCALGIGAVQARGAEAQARGGAAAGATSACSLLTAQEIKTLLGAQTPRFIDMIPANEEKLAGGASECFIGTVTIQLDAVSVARFSANMTTYADRTKYERVTGVGDEAYFYEQDPGKTSHVVGVYARTGQHVFVVSMDLNDTDTAPALRPSAITLAKAIVPKLR